MRIRSLFGDQGVATLNVYLPEALKAEMDSMEGINWSQVAQEAFRETIIRSNAVSGKTEAVIERLRATAGKKGQVYKDAYEEGRAWAQQVAEADELEMLAELDLSEYLAKAQDEPGRAAQWIFGDEFGYDDVTELLGGKRITEGRLKGFVDGALEVWKEVRSKL
jgi:hypothetical protein